MSLAEQGRFRDALVIAEKCVAMHADRDSYSVLAWVLVAGELNLDRGIAMAEAGRAIPPRTAELVLFLPQPPPEHALGLARLRPNRALIRQHLAEARRGG